MNFHILTLFPEMIEQACGHSILKRAAAAGLLTVNCVNIRDFAVNKHGQVDDAPYGGGAGMVMMAPPIYDAYKSVTNVIDMEKMAKIQRKFIYLSPQGRIFKQSIAEELAMEKEIILLCGHYEGIDQRIIDLLQPDEISIGDYVLTGGELAALVIIDAVARLIPGVLGKDESYRNESFGMGTGGLLEGPQYTRPPEFNGLSVPSILLSGHHKQIEEWRQNQSVERTRQRRPDLL